MTPQTPTLVEGVGGGLDVTYSIDPPLPNASLGAITLSPGVRSGTLAADASGIAYRPPEFTNPAGYATASVWLPAGTAPTNGWPVYLINFLAGWAGFPALTSIDPTDPNGNFAYLHDLINAGVAVVWIGINGGGTETFQPGWFYPPGHSSGDWENRNSYMPEHSLLDGIQWVKDQATYPLDGDRICIAGFSAGIISNLWVACYPELALTSGSTQIQQSAAVNCAVVQALVADFLAYADTWDTASLHFESRFNPGTDSANLLDTEQAVRTIACLTRMHGIPGNRIWNLPMFIACAEPTTATYDSWGLDSDLYPVLRDRLGFYTHDLFSSGITAHILRRINPDLHDTSTELWVSESVEDQLGPLIGEADDTFVGDIGDTGGGSASVVATLHPSMEAWVVARLTEDKPDPSGLLLDTHTGTIFGTPNTTQAATVHTITASNDLGSTSYMVTIDVT